MPTKTQIEDAIYDWINGLGVVSSSAIIWAFQNAAIPDPPYFSLNLNNFMQIGDDFIAYPDATGKSQIIGNREFTLEILGFGDGVIEKTWAVRDSLNDPNVLTQFRDVGFIMYRSLEPVLNISGIDESENEERSSYDVMFRTDNIVTDVEFGLIEKTNAVGTLEGGGTSPDTVNINVDAS